MSTMVSLRLPVELQERVKQAAERYDMTTGELWRMAATEWLDRRAVTELAREVEAQREAEVRALVV